MYILLENFVPLAHCLITMTLHEILIVPLVAKWIQKRSVLFGKKWQKSEHHNRHNNICIKANFYVTSTIFQEINFLLKAIDFLLFFNYNKTKNHFISYPRSQDTINLYTSKAQIV
jgi:hypothetical protein